MKLPQRAFHRFNLVNLVVTLDAFAPLLPQFAVSRLLPGSRHRAAVDPQIEVESLGQSVHEAVCLREQIPGIDQDHRHTRVETRYKVE